MRRAAKVDKTQEEIVDYLRANDFSVFITAPLGRGVPDLVVARRATKFAAVVECKTGSEKLNEMQRDWRDEWGGHYIVANSGPEALKGLTLAELSGLRLKTA